MRADSAEPTTENEAKRIIRQSDPEAAATGQRPLGFANPALYATAATGYASNFTDITSGNNDYLSAHAGLYPATTAYDMASGLGSPKAAALSVALCVASGATQALAAGSFGSVGVQGTLQLTGGTYQFASLSLGPNATMVLTVVPTSDSGVAPSSG